MTILKDFRFALIIISIFCVQALFSQSGKGKIAGRIIDEQKLELPGATIMVLGSGIGTATGLDGDYVLDLDPGSYTVEIGFIGYKSQQFNINVKTGETTVLDAQLFASNIELNEVVVTAIGIKQSKRRLGYATQQLKDEAIQQSNPINLGAALSGQISGLRVTNPTGIFQQPALSLRGNKPLLVIDGIPVESDLFDVASNNVESISVMKGTSASALYGARGKNGAVLITTKNAKKEGLEINVNLSTMVTAGYTVFPETQGEYGSGSEGKYEFWDGADGGISDGDMTWGPKFAPGLLVKQWNSPIRNKQTGEEIPWYGDVKGSVYDDRSVYERVPIPFVQHDNLADFMRTGIVSQGSFNLSNKGKISDAYFSMNFTHQVGQVPNTKLTSGSLLFNYNVKLAPTLALGLNTTYNKVYSPNYPRYGYGPKNHMYTILLWMSDDVNGKELKNHQYRPDMYGFRQANYNYAWYNNPYFMAYEATQLHSRDVLNGQLKLNWDVTPKINIQGRAAARVDKRFEDMKVPKSYMNYGDSRNGDFKNWNNTDLDINTDVLIAYQDKLSENLDLTINAGAANLYKQHNQQFQQTDGLIVPFVYSLSNSEGPVQATNYLSEKSINSLYATANIDLFHSVFLTLSGRNDWASTLSKAKNSYFYPSVSLSTVLSDYVKMPRFMDFLKVYASWAVVSNDLDPYRLSSVYNKGVMFGSIPSVNYPSNLSNPEIAPEKTTSYEAGISTALFGNKINLELTYYRYIDENQIINLPISIASGFSSRLVNGNVYNTNGFEVMLSAKPIVSKNFIWNLTANFSGQAKVLKEIYNNNSSYGNLKVGDRADAIYDRVWLKSADGKLILDKNGMPTRSSFLENVGNSNPDYMFGLQNVFTVKDFRINLDFDGAIGGTLVSQTHQKMWWAGKHPKSTTWRDAEYTAGKPVYVPEGVVVVQGELKRDLNGKVVSDTRTYTENTTAVSWQSWAQNYPYRASVSVNESKEFANTFDMSYLKLRRIAISYDINKLIKLSKIKALDLTLFGNNLFVLKNTPLLDPDFGSSDRDLQDPSARYVGISASIKF